MKKCIFFLIAFISFLSGLAAQEEPLKSRITVIPIKNFTEDPQYDALCATMTETLIFNFNISNKYSVEKDVIFDPYENDKERDRYFKFNNADYVIYGKAERDDQGVITLEINVYDNVEEENIIQRQESIENVLYIFDAADSLIDTVYTLFSENHMGFGSLVLSNRGARGDYELLINGISVGTNISEIPKIFIGSHSVVITQNRMLGPYTVFDETLLIDDDAPVLVDFSIPRVTDEENRELLKREDFIKLYWNNLKKSEEITAAFDELEQLLDDLSYSEELYRELVKYEMWQDIYWEKGEVPGVRKGKRLVHNYFSLDIGYARGNPMGNASDLLEKSHIGKIEICYNLNNYWGIVSTGISSSFQNQGSVDENLLYPFDLMLFSLGALVSYTTQFYSPFFVQAGFSGGLALASFTFDADQSVKDDDLLATSYLEPFAGVGIYLARSVGLKFMFRIPFVFYHDMVQGELAPGVNLTVNF